MTSSWGFDPPLGHLGVHPAYYAERCGKVGTPPGGDKFHWGNSVAARSGARVSITAVYQILHDYVVRVCALQTIPSKWVPFILFYPFYAVLM